MRRAIPVSFARGIFAGRELLSMGHGKMSQRYRSSFFSSRLLCVGIRNDNFPQRNYASEPKGLNEDDPVARIKSRVKRLTQRMESGVSITMPMVAQTMILWKQVPEPSGKTKERLDRYFKQLVELLPFVTRGEGRNARELGRIVRYLCAHREWISVFSVMSKAKEEGVPRGATFRWIIRAGIDDKMPELISYAWDELELCSEQVVLPLDVYKGLVQWHAMRKETGNVLKVIERLTEDKRLQRVAGIAKDDLPTPSMLASLIYSLTSEKEYDQALALIQRWESKLDQHANRAKSRNGATLEDPSGWDRASAWRAYGAFFEACVKRGYNARVVKMFETMLAEKKVPALRPNMVILKHDREALVRLMEACAKKNRYDLIQEVMKQAVEIGGLGGQLPIFFLLFGSFKKIPKEQMGAVVSIWESLKKLGFNPERASYETMIRLCLVRDHVTAQRFVQEMQKLGIEPDNQIKGMVQAIQEKEAKQRLKEGKGVRAKE